MSIDCEIRSAAVADLEYLLHHRRAMFLDMGHTEQEMEPTIRGARSYLQSALADGSCRAWIATREDQVVGGGFIVFAHWPAVPGSSDTRRPWILNVYIEPEFRHRGIARLLMQTMVEFCRMHGFPSVSLHASQAGRPLYESLGFQPTNEMKLELR